MLRINVARDTCNNQPATFPVTTRRALAHIFLCIFGLITLFINIRTTFVSPRVLPLEVWEFYSGTLSMKMIYLEHYNMQYSYIYAEYYSVFFKKEEIYVKDKLCTFFRNKNIYFVLVYKAQVFIAYEVTTRFSGGIFLYKHSFFLMTGIIVMLLFTSTLLFRYLIIA